MKKKMLSALVCVAMVSSLLVGCKDTSTTNDTTSEQTSEKTEEATEEEVSQDGGKVYYLNYKPEVEEVWNEIAEKYTTETGVEVKVVTAASGTYEEVLKSEIAKEDAPTLFQVNGPIGYSRWKDYCKNLEDSELYTSLADQSIAVKGSDGTGVYGIPYTVESYGIIYNAAIMNKYFETEGAIVKSAEEINNFDTLKQVVEDMTAKKDALEIQGVFASTSLLTGEDWRWQTHLANLPIYYEYKAKNVTDLAEVEFTYGDNFKNIFDLYINNSCTKPGLLGSKTVTDSMAEFALGQVAMVQNGNWAWGQISGVEGNLVKEEDIKFLPIYVGAEGEESQGLCTGTENFWCINSKASEADQKATEDFANWLISSDTGKDYMVNQLGNAAPFTTFGEDEKPTDPLAKEMFRYMDAGKTSVSWNFTTFPSQTFKDDFGAALLEYANGNMTWDEVAELFISEWASEKAAVTE